MSEDARFEDGVERPLMLRALDAEDVSVVSAVVQDAIFPVSEMRWDRRARRFSLLVNRFRWEDAAETRPPERVQSILNITDVLSVRSQGIDRTDPDLILSLLCVEWEGGPDGTGQLTLVLAGDGAIALQVEAVGIDLRDVTRPYIAPSGRRPDHPS